MGVAIRPDLEIDEEIAEFLQRHDAEAALRAILDLAWSCFPQMRSVKLELQDDVDEDSRRYVVVYVSLPNDLAPELLIEQNRRYHARLVSEVPLALCPLFVLAHDIQ